MDNARIENRTKHQQHHPPAAAVAGTSIKSDDIPVALYAQYQPVPPIPACPEVPMRAATTVEAIQRDEWLRETNQSSAAALAAAAAAARRQGVSTMASASASVTGIPPYFSTVLDLQAKQAVGEAKAHVRKNHQRYPGQMGSGVLRNAVGVWTSSGISVSESRASKVDETVDVGAQANPSGVYPVVQPMAFRGFPTQQPPRTLTRLASQKQQQAAEVAATTNPMPARAHPFGPGMQHLPHGPVHFRPFSAPASMLSTSSSNTTPRPAGGAFKHPLPHGVGPRRASNAALRAKGISTPTGHGLSKAEARAAARATAVASVISAVADSKTNEARAAAAVAAAAAAAATATAAATADTAALERRGTEPLRRGRSKRNRECTGGEGRGAGTKQPRRPVTAPASSTAAVAAAGYVRSKKPLHDLLYHHQHQQLPPQNYGTEVPWGTGAPTPTRPQWSSDCCAPLRPRGQAASSVFTVQKTPLHRSSGEALLYVGPTTAATEVVVAAATAPIDGKAGGIDKKSLAGKVPEPEPMARSSPESEDIYTDSWLTGMPWAFSSPPKAESLELEVPVTPAPLDALRSDDRGTRGDADDGEDDGVEEATLFMHHQDHHGQIPPSVQYGTDTHGGGRVEFASQETGVRQFYEREKCGRIASSRNKEAETTGSVSNTQGIQAAGCNGIQACTDGRIGAEHDLSSSSELFSMGGEQSSESSGAAVRISGCTVDKGSTVHRTPQQMTGLPVGLSQSPPLTGRPADANRAEPITGPASAPYFSSSPPPVPAGAARQRTSAPADLPLLQEHTALSSSDHLSSPSASAQSTPHHPISPDTGATAATLTSLPIWVLQPPALPGLDATSSPPFAEPRQVPSTSIPPTQTAVAEAVGKITRQGSNSAASVGTGRSAAATATFTSPGRRAPALSTTAVSASSTATTATEKRSGTAREAATAQPPAAVAGVAASAIVSSVPVSHLNRSRASVGADRVSSISAHVTPPPTLTSSEWRAAVARAWVCADDTCPKPADYERPDAKNRGGVSIGAAASAGVGCSNKRGTANEMQKVRWCAAHRPEGAELSPKTICSFPGCRSRWSWGHEAVEDIRKNLTRCCMQHKHAGMYQLRQEAAVNMAEDKRDQNPGRNSAAGETATRRSKRRRSSGNVLE